METQKECQCKRCGSSMESVMCSGCAGDGYFEHDCFDDSCCCSDPEDELCGFCHGDGRFLVCISSQEWCEAHPLPGREDVKRNTVEWFDMPLVKRTRKAA